MSALTALFEKSLETNDSSLLNIILNTEHKVFNYVDMYPLHLAISYDNFEAFVHILKRMKKDGVLTKEINKQTPESKNTPLFLTTINKSRYSMCKILLQNNADPNIKNVDGFTPFHNAVVMNNKPACLILIEYNADITTLNKYNKSPLKDACYYEHTTIINLILETIVKRTKKDLDYSQLIYILSLFKYKYYNICELDDTNCEKHTFKCFRTIYQICEDGNYSIFKKLVDKGENFSGFDSKHKTCLHIAVYRGHYDICKYILDKTNNVDINVIDEYKNTPLHISCITGNMLICKLLLDRGANFEAKNMTNYTPYDVAKLYGFNNICEIIKTCADYNKYLNTKNRLSQYGIEI